MSRPAVSLLVLLGLPVLLLLLVPGAVLLGFAAILLAIALRGGAEALARPLRLPDWAGVVAVVLGIIGALGLGAWLVAPTLLQQADELLQRLPGAWDQIRATLGETRWGRVLLDEFAPGDVLSQVGRATAGAATAAVAGTANRLTDFIFLLFLCLFLAISPKPYLAGLRALVAPEWRPRFDPVLLAMGAALRAWVGAQMLAMAIVGGLSFIGLTLLGMPLAGILAALAALLGFIPILGPIIAAVPAVLLAFGEGWSMVLWVIGLYIAIQTIEGDLVTPLVQSRAINLPPGLILLAQLVMLGMFGLLGLALAAPLAALLLVLGKRLYVDAFLERQDMPAPPTDPRGA
jgi:predicted PurR-regulated permease PerM